MTLSSQYLFIVVFLKGLFHLSFCLQPFAFGVKLVRDDIVLMNCETKADQSPSEWVK